MVEEARVVRDEGRSRYEVWVGDTRAGFADFQEVGNSTILTHTEVSNDFAGQGLGTRLATGALDDVVARGHKIVPVCSFIADFVARNPRFAPHVRQPRPQGGGGDE
ncbi:N-acetyltransferase [Actinoalloteichus sp. AHMU CJ021]|uniref:N-acetyltransferase domain-containing protein n=1 Tax=Actinoalloteichus caeruleus DSM 43889 TaxID=1120930 RepID=A0ABT1JES5_ACTCY|nr:GNAT family N-acetyltransferase [Actinoalloteichus caeruleus]AUS77199.1 N-acetyltransferase [Actinoalloteichus sp. AHMU CJ021]MCP2331002.1 hypothetical protein [Actinoalloteichus caeruleus DSM 43889]